SLPWLGEPIFRHGVTALCHDDQPYAHDFERFGGRGLPIAAVVLLVETLPDGTGLAGKQRDVLDRYRQGMFLTGVAHVRKEAEIRSRRIDAVAFEIGFALRDELLEHTFHLDNVEFADPSDEGPKEVLPPRAHQ